MKLSKSLSGVSGEDYAIPAMQQEHLPPADVQAEPGRPEWLFMSSLLLLDEFWTLLPGPEVTTDTFQSTSAVV